MTRKAFILAAALAVVLSFPALAADRVVAIEAGYGYIFSADGIAPQGGNGVLTSLYYGYLVGDAPYGSTVLSLALGYDWFPQAVGAGALHAIVYGVEYAHTFFQHNPVALTLSYGLLFNLLLQEGRPGYAFGHHTRLAAGPVFSLGGAGALALTVGYNFVTFPYYELSSARIMYPSLALRYQLSF